LLLGTGNLPPARVNVLNRDENWSEPTTSTVTIRAAESILQGVPVLPGATLHRALMGVGVSMLSAKIGIVPPVRSVAIVL
jgi:hypothetical protein